MNAFLRAAQRLTTPLLPDDYLGLIDPMWVRGAPRAEVLEVIPETATAATLILKPSAAVPEWRPGQHIGLGVDIDGVRHTRTYSLSAPPAFTGVAPEGRLRTTTPVSARGESRDPLRVTVQLQPGGVVSAHLVTRTKSGDVLHLGSPAGDFALPTDVPPRLLFIAGGSGITPIMAMIRALRLLPTRPAVTLIYSTRGAERRIFDRELQTIAEDGWLQLHCHDTARSRRLQPTDVAALVPDWCDQPTWACGPAALLDDLVTFWRTGGGEPGARDVSDDLSTERFVLDRGIPGAGGTVRFELSGRATEVDGSTTLLAAGEQAGVLMPHGCRMGICHTCVVPLRRGQVQDVRTGLVHGRPGDLVQTCVSAAAGDLELTV